MINVSSKSSNYLNGPLSRNRIPTSGEPLSNEIEEISSIQMHPLKATPSNEITRTKQATKLKVVTQKSAIVLSLIVILFIITHCYRMALKIYTVTLPELHTAERFGICFTMKR